MNRRPVVLTVAGSDSAGMAGVQMDTRVQTALGVHCATALTAVTAQNSLTVTSVNPVPTPALQQQMAAALPLKPAMIKSGLLVRAEQAVALGAFVRQHNIPLVCDPVMWSSSAHPLVEPDLVLALRRELLPCCHLLLPNRDEAATLANMAIETPEDVENAAKRLLDQGVQAVFIKGGHSQGPLSQDYFANDTQQFWLSSPRAAAANHRGTGCALASAAAAALALGLSVADAVVIGKMAVNQGLRRAYGWEGQQGPVHIDRFPNHQADLPVLSKTPAVTLDAPRFPACHHPPMGLYPIVDRAVWLKRLLPEGVTSIQLRIKDLQGPALAREISEAIALARQWNARLFINDHWQLAIEQGAYGVHLGQEDLDSAELRAIRAAGLRLGISTHCHYEVARAHALKPSYLACGPVYPTTTKVMPWTPQGLAGLAYWRDVLDYPLVAIGGISAERLPAVAASGVDGVAMITAITQAPAPEQTTANFVGILRQAGQERA